MKNASQKVGIHVVPLPTIQPNPLNPRIIKDTTFHNLVQSLKEFPEMMGLRPIIVNSKMMILGGNQRYKAAVEAGWKEIPIIIAEGLTSEQEREFIVKDNASAGEWDFEALRTDGWEADLLLDWAAIELPAIPDPEAKETDQGDLSQSADSYLNGAIRQIVLYFDVEQHKQVLADLAEIGERYGIEEDNSATVLKLIELYREKGNEDR
ncbi:hypothetical protein BWI97_15780 [Siphonobacter sp. BAB-5405]|uniref:ParB N-terminal domain-containing protein n=1 Tax=Siphonobacter sp. BAB-5405 TaxID=1864825 RepID=UPI000C7FEBC6|nr:ParB N-terminal domain-containing protein [Siphonobacter sp. BAB-5405]PMD94856.1 hypothetical protein BWI97_15780 [Siphonobacter sp. BAB-5405]